MKRVIWLGIVVLVAAGLVAVRMKRVQEKESAPTVATVAPAVQVATVREGRVVRTRQVLGTVVGAEEADVAPRVMAQIVDVRVREGDVVTRGQVLAQLDARELEDAVAEAETALQTAKEALAAADTALAVQRATTARDRVLVDAKAIAKEQWDRSRAAEAAATAQQEAAQGQVTIAERRLSQAKVRLDYARLTAPFDGVVAARLADPGSLGVPGRPVVKLVRQRGIRVRAALPAEDFAALHVGQPVVLDVGPNGLTVRVSRVVPAMGEAHLAVFEADVADPPPSLVSGATVGVAVQLTAATGLTVPADTLFDTAGGTFVWRVSDGTVHAVKVTVLARSQDDAVVSGALAAGDRVVEAQPARMMALVDGAAVQAVQR
jgi:RND family efflux transporter MFP subunit